MTEKRSTLDLSHQYQTWPYPAPLSDIADWQAKGGAQQCDPCLDHDLFWPERAYDPRISILIAGCGTNEAALQAYNLPHAKVVGIDISDASLEHQEALKKKHNLSNLELIHLDLHEVGTLKRQFDLIVSFGVVHHQQNPSEALKCLSYVLKNDGVMLISLYEKYLRHGVYMIQRALQNLRLTQSVEDVRLVRDLVSNALPPWHPARAYIASSNDLTYDAGLVDTFLHVSDRAFTVPEVLELVKNAGLDFQGWFDNLFYYPDGALTHLPRIYEKLISLPLHDQWATIELLVPPNGHTFMLRHQGKAGVAQVDFESENWDQLVPSARQFLKIAKTGTNEAMITREWHKRALNNLDCCLFSAIDGKKAIHQIIKQTAISTIEARAFFESMWRCGHLTMSMDYPGKRMASKDIA